RGKCCSSPAKLRFRPSAAICTQPILPWCLWKRPGISRARPPKTPRRTYTISSPRWYKKPWILQIAFVRMQTQAILTENKGPPVRRVNPDLKATPDLKGKKATPAPSDLKGNRDRRERRATQVRPDRRAQRVILVTLARKDRRVSKAKKETPANPDPRGRKVTKAIQANRARLGRKAQKAILALASPPPPNPTLAKFPRSMRTAPDMS